MLNFLHEKAEARDLSPASLDDQKSGSHIRRGRSDNIVGSFDLRTGIEVPLSMFYLVPVFWASWAAGLGPGMGICLMATAAYFVTHFTPER